MKTVGNQNQMSCGMSGKERNLGHRGFNVHCYLLGSENGRKEMRYQPVLSTSEVINLLYSQFRGCQFVKPTVKSASIWISSYDVSSFPTAKTQFLSC